MVEFKNLAYVKELPGLLAVEKTTRKQDLTYFDANEDKKRMIQFD